MEGSHVWLAWLSEACRRRLGRLAHVATAYHYTTLSLVRPLPAATSLHTLVFSLHSPGFIWISPFPSLSPSIMNFFTRKSSRSAPQKQPPSRRPTLLAAAPAVPPPTSIANSTLDLRTSCSSLVSDDSNITPLQSSAESQHRTLTKPAIGRKILNDQNANGSHRPTSVSFLPSFLRFPT